MSIKEKKGFRKSAQSEQQQKRQEGKHRKWELLKRKNYGSGVPTPSGIYMRSVISRVKMAATNSAANEGVTIHEPESVGT